MEKTPVSVRLSIEEHKILKDIQQKRREESGKKTALSEIVKEYMLLGIQNEGNEQESADFEHYSAQFEQNLSDNSQSLPHFEQKSKKNRSVLGYSAIKWNFVAEKMIIKRLELLEKMENRLREDRADIEETQREVQEEAFEQRLTYNENVDLRTQLDKANRELNEIRSAFSLGGLNDNNPGSSHRFRTDKIDFSPVTDKIEKLETKIERWFSETERRDNTQNENHYEFHMKTYNDLKDCILKSKDPNIWEKLIQISPLLAAGIVSLNNKKSEKRLSEMISNIQSETQTLKMAQNNDNSIQNPGSVKLNKDEE